MDCRKDKGVAATDILESRLGVPQNLILQPQDYSLGSWLAKCTHHR